MSEIIEKDVEDLFPTIDDVLRELDSLSVHNHPSRSGLFHQRVQKWKADMCVNNELQQIYCLVDSHVPTLRERTAMRYERLLAKKLLDEKSVEHLKFLKNIIFTKCPSDTDEHIQEMLQQIEELPKEWTLIQITLQHKQYEMQNLNLTKLKTNDLHIIVFDCGQKIVEPFMVKAKKPEESRNSMGLLEEVMFLVKENRDRLINISGKKSFRNFKEKEEYFRSRERVDESMNVVVQRIQTSWLREWKCLFIGKYQDKNIETFIKDNIDHYLKTENLDIKTKQKEILYRIVKGFVYLSSKEIERGLKYCTENCSNASLKKLCSFIRSLNNDISTNFENKTRHPVILIVDECLESVPWEMIHPLEDHPVSRLPSLHFVYLLYKTHEKDIEDGHKIIRNYENGSYIVNPDSNLATMEKRMISFYNYWVPEWKGIANRKPINNEFIQMLTESEIFSYNGHGNGAHLMSLDALQKQYVKAVVMLFGCASIKISKLGPQTETYGSYHMYLISRCPCVVGMLWEVTDSDTDILTAEFISRWIPSKASTHWSHMDKTLWTKSSELKKVKASMESVNEFNNAELLRALCHAKNSAKFYMTKAACVVRGLPVKIK